MLKKNLREVLALTKVHMEINIIFFSCILVCSENIRKVFHDSRGTTTKRALRELNNKLSEEKCFPLFFWDSKIAQHLKLE